MHRQLRIFKLLVDYNYKIASLMYIFANKNLSDLGFSAD